MTDGQVVRRILKPLLWIGCLVPTAWLIRGILQGDLGADPVKTLTHTTGLSALVILLVTLGVTPVRRLLDRPALVLLRRPLGLFAWSYAVLHFLIYAVFDHQLSAIEISEDIVKHPWVLVGFSALVLLTTLASTSPAAMVRRLGARRWHRLHRMIYPAAALVIVHFLWLVKKDITEPVRYGVVLGVLLLARAIPALVRPRAGARPATEAP